LETVIPIHGLPDWLLMIFILLCMFMVSFFSSSEAALLSVSRLKIRYLAGKGDKAAQAVERLKENYSRLFSTILALENMLIILASSLGTALGIFWFKDKGVWLATLIMTPLVVIFGEIVPKTFAAGNSEKYALRVSRLMELVVKISSPLIALFNFFANIILKLLKAKTEKKGLFSPQEFKEVVLMEGSRGLLPKAESDLIKGVLEFGDQVAKEVMVPRVEMDCFSAEMNRLDMIEKIQLTGHSRFPVFEGGVDNVIGVVYAKDLLKGSAENQSITAKDIARSIFFAPGNQKILSLLSELKEKKYSMAIILDEFGGTAGLVTMETLLEAIVGEIEDEYDLTSPGVSEVKSDTYLLKAATDVGEVEDILKITFPPGDYRSIGGVLIEEMGCIPQKGESVEYQGYIFAVEELDSYKLKTLKVYKQEA